MEHIPYCDQLINKKGFSEKPMVPPPSERGLNVVQFELTTGCSYGRCTFCDIYDGPSSYREKSLDEFKNHVDSVLSSCPTALIERVFIGSGNALSVDTDKLIKATQYSLVALHKKTKRNPRRLALYGNTLDIINQGNEGVHELSCGGTCGDCSIGYFGTKLGVSLVYWGLESGNNEVLKIAGKGYNSDQASWAGNILRRNVKNSTMVMPGLGGMTYFNEHIKDTARILNESRPEYITFMGLQIKKDTPYSTWIDNQEQLNKNRRLTHYEISEQTAQIIERLDFSSNIGVHGFSVHGGFCINPTAIGSESINGILNAKNLAQKIREKMADLKLN